jgi:hypothetical protein
MQRTHPRSRSVAVVDPESTSQLPGHRSIAMAGSYRVWALAEENDHPLPQVAREL